MKNGARGLRRLDFNKKIPPLGIVTHWCRIDADSREARNYKEQYHSFFELHLCLTGECRFDISGKELVLTEHKYLLLRPMEKHRLTDASDDFTKLVFGFSLEDEDISISLAAGASRLEVREASDGVCTILGTLLSEAERPDRFGSLAIIQSLLRGLVTLLIREHTDACETERVFKESHEMIGEISKFIKENLCARVGLGEASRWFCLSERQLERVCLSEAGISFGEIKRRIQYERIRALLSETTLPLSRIAAEAGFADEYSMSKFFTRREGTPPARFRRMRRVEMS